MYVGFYNYYKYCNKNRILTDPNGPPGSGDETMYGFVMAVQRLQALGHKVATLDMDDLEKFDVALFFDHPTFKDPYFQKFRKLPGKKLYLFLMENEANRPDQYWRFNHRPFEKVFTWHSDWVDYKKYFPFAYSMRMPNSLILHPEEKTKFCVTIASQKYNPHPRQLYRERLGVVRWFEREHPGEFDLYGQAWDRHYFKGGFSRLNLLLEQFYRKFPNSFRYNLFPSWRGRVPNKHMVMRQYKYALCYENAVFPGYVSEKIFDAFFAGCIPVYLGAPNVTDYIPPETFIDRRKFKSNAEVYHYMKTMPEKEYQAYLTAITNFVGSEKARVFSGESFAEVIVKNIAESPAA